MPKMKTKSGAKKRFKVRADHRPECMQGWQPAIECAL